MPLRATGTRGSWFATVEGVSYPCAHEYWWRPDPVTGQRVYNDPNYEDTPRWQEYVAALRGGRAILTRDTTPDEGRNFERSGYIALYEIADVRIEDSHLLFRFTARIDNLE